MGFDALGKSCTTAVGNFDTMQFKTLHTLRGRRVESIVGRSKKILELWLWAIQANHRLPFRSRVEVRLPSVMAQPHHRLPRIFKEVGLGREAGYACLWVDIQGAPSTEIIRPAAVVSLPYYATLYPPFPDKCISIPTRKIDWINTRGEQCKYNDVRILS